MESPEKLGSPKRELEVCRELNSIEKRIEELNSVFAELQGRLTWIIREDSKEPQGEEDRSQPSTELAGRIRGFDDKVRNIINRIQFVINSLEL